MAEQTDLVARYQKIIEISRDLVSTLNLDEQLDKIVFAAAELCDAEAVSLLLYDESRAALFFQAATNLDEPLRRGIAIPMDSLAGWMVNNRKPVLIGAEGDHSVSNDKRHFGEVKTGFVTRSLLGVPLIVKHNSFGVMEEKVVGVIEVINKRNGIFNEQDQELINALGAQAAVAIENTQLFQQSDLISEFVHELRAPLAALNNAAYLLQRADRNVDQNSCEPAISISLELRKRALQTITSESGYLTEMADDFLSLARLESGRAQFQARLFDVGQLLQECIGLMKAKAMEKKMSLSLIYPEQLPYLRADRSKIKQVVLNLLSNAIKFTPDEGHVELAAESIGQEMIISVRDTGRGIPLKLLDFVFDKFYRVPGSEKVAPGTGLGLAICKKIVESHNGKIEIACYPRKREWQENREMLGTRVLVILPLKSMLEKEANGRYLNPV
jgi:signal transduction histidine kinase